ncbi:flagellar basal body P-ring protein FlgI [Zestomonas thermotolerans]|uniref:flagellar basal body P-ring protein FlgI n=1 Tax=Zestomonas thermotolerans TaxID=157784 RepID=UPI00035DE9FA
MQMKSWQSLMESGSTRQAFALGPRQDASPALCLRRQPDRSRAEREAAPRSHSCRQQFASNWRAYRRRGANDWLLLATLLFGLLLSPLAHAERLKDLASIQGVRSNQLIGYGLVVGLNGSGDQTTQTPFTLQTFNNMLAQFGIKVPASVGNVQLKNVAAVSVHAELPPFAKPGQTIDITVSSIGNAKSLRGGSLLMTPLKGIDGNVYAIAQGNLVVGGFDAEGGDGSRVTVNVPSTGRIPGGATVERPVPSGFDQGNSLVLNLNRPDFTTAKNIVDQINQLLGPGVAQAIDGGSVRVSAPLDPGQRVDYLSVLENLEIEAGQAQAKVIINSRTGTIVIGQNVRVQPAAVTHGSLTVAITEDPIVSQPNAFSGGQTAVVPRSRIDASEEAKPMFKFAPGTSLDEIVRAVNQVGASPSDLMAILEALKQAGALQAELIVI